MATLIDYILIPIDLWTIVLAHAWSIDMIPSDPEVSKWNQPRWPSNCTGFHGHHVMWNSSIKSIKALRLLTEVAMHGDGHRTARALTCITGITADRLKRRSVDLLQTIVALSRFAKLYSLSIKETFQCHVVYPPSYLSAFIWRVPCYPSFPILPDCSLI